MFPHRQLRLKGAGVFSGENGEAVEDALLLLVLENWCAYKLVAEVGLAVLNGEARDHAIAIQERLLEAVPLEHGRPIAKQRACKQPPLLIPAR